MRIARILSPFFVFGLAACGPQTLPSTAQLASTRAPNGAYPIGPDGSVTPGSLCPHPDSYRYPEHIGYCHRNVAPAMKRDIIAQYDRDFGYHVGSLNRGDVKIDHYIPLCMGGSNERNNLWPQYKTIYVQTDQIEEKLCEMMSRGRLKQADAVQKMTHVKNHLDEAAQLNQELSRELGHG